jgi:hypothetical protein
MARALESGDPADRRKALENLRQALELTRAIDDDRPAGHSPEESRNLCYILLWHACFAPKSEETGRLYRQAMDSACQSGDNPAFIQRAAHLATYRAHLEGLSIPLPWWPDEGVALPETGYWVAATALKYHATVLAARGEFGKAANLFENMCISSTLEERRPIQTETPFQKTWVCSDVVVKLAGCSPQVE